MLGFVVSVTSSVVLLTRLMHYFNSYDFSDRFSAAEEEIAEWISQGLVKRKFQIEEGGVESLPKHLPLLYSGGNLGKLWVHQSVRLYCISRRMNI